MSAGLLLPAFHLATLSSQLTSLFYESPSKINSLADLILSLAKYGSSKRYPIVELQIDKIKNYPRSQTELPRTSARTEGAGLIISKYVRFIAAYLHLSYSYCSSLYELGCNLATTSNDYYSNMIISNIINDSFGLLSKQLRFYCWHFRRSLDQRQRQELIELLYEQHFERLANKIKSIYQTTAADCKQQVGKLLFEHCLTRNRRHQLIQLIESELVDVNVRLDNYGRTLLHRSAYNLDVDLVKILIKYGVNIRLRDYAGNTALHIAIQSYRNGAVIYGNGTDVVRNLTSIIEVLLEADKNLLEQRYTRKRIKLLREQTELNNRVPQPTRNNIACNELHETDRNASTDDRLALLSKSRSVNSGRVNSGNQDRVTSDHVKGCTYSSKFNHQQQSTETSSALLLYETREFTGKQTNNQDDQPTTIDPILLEDISSPLVDTKNAFGRTALHYCVLVVGEQHLSHFVQLLLSHGADTNVVDTKMKTPLYCLVKRPGISAIRQKLTAITHLLESGCDDLGLAIQPRIYFTDQFIKSLEQNLSSVMQTELDSPIEPIFNRNSFIRVPSLKHITRLNLIRNQDEKLKLMRQTKLSLPDSSPHSLRFYVNRRILDQSEFF